MKPSRAKAVCELLDTALKIFFEAVPAEPVCPGDPDYRLVRARQREPLEAFPIREVEARLAQLKRVRAG